MRVHVMATPRNTPPMEAMSVLVQGFVEWRQRYRDRMEVFEFFPGGGGFAIVNVPDEATLQQMIMEYPFTPFQNMDVRLVVPGDQGLQQLQALAQRLSGGG